MLLAVPESFSFADREKISQIVFEKLNAPGLLMVDQPLCALYGENNFSGMVIDIGHETIGRNLCLLAHLLVE
jgi:actin-related protein